MHKLLSVPLAAAFVALSASSQAALINFDDLNPGGSSIALPNGYAGLSWVNLSAIAPFNIGGWTNNGAQNGIVSLPNVAYDSAGGPAQFSSVTPFTLGSANFVALWRNNMQFTVTGALNGVVVDTASFSAGTTASVFKTFNWGPIDTVVISASGGTAVSGLGASSTQFAIDNVILVPEPSTAALMLIGFAAIGAVARRRSV